MTVNELLEKIGNTEVPYEAQEAATAIASGVMMGVEIMGALAGLFFAGLALWVVGQVVHRIRNPRPRRRIRL